MSLAGRSADSVTVEDARRTLLDQLTVLPSEEVARVEASGPVLGADVRTPNDLHSCHTSRMAESACIA